MRKLLTALGPVTAIIGAQWGDEGKGKIVDLLSEHFGVLARACGGANAGHTIVVEGKRHIFHLLPAGCLHEQLLLVLGSGMVIHLPTLLEEIEALEGAGIAVRSRLKISRAAHIVLEEHRGRDAHDEEERGERALGTTRRGIGPAYADKAARRGLRMEVLLTEESNSHPELTAAADLLRPCITDTVALLHELLCDGKSLLIEGAQGTLLDLDHGTYPYVTSSATSAAGALQGLGLPPRVLTSCLGVTKAYCTRVGGGPFPTEADPARAERLRERGQEYGATTGRPRRCGWLSLGDLQRSAAINGFTHLALTKLDVLDGEETIPVSGEPGAWKKLPGWKEVTQGRRTFEELPLNAQRYVHFIEDHIGIPIALIGTGPEREHVIRR
jgi:adenylosuccinate synthase